ncbi:MAG TPA: N(4)-(beta-N-acetylglucosaminyl)-L-asparaginase [Pyrinomonadaceae bacterium]|jgi:N4-(beta-N-acetylglucosaminyl)-L-asparaginase|nr:N(4)-(beta-N-acetylglucosaminyl)-L-asparaginase [Pyrinomonadaceae bacterium]
MTKRIKRRDFMRTSAAAGLTLAGTKASVLQFPNIIVQSAVKPIVVASSNGNKFKHDGNVTAVQKAFTMITQGADVLDAVIAGVNIVELDPLDDSVGYGGLPNAEGVVQLDSSCMHGPKKRAGAVASLEGVRTPSLVAKAVLENTDHHLIVGKGAQEFARSMGFKIEDDLNTENSRRRWLEWKRKIDPSHYLDPKTRSEAGRRAALEMLAEGKIREENLHGTINCNGINSKGEICGVTTTSGLAWKIPGRVGDSPILGAGLYVDGAVGAAGSTGRGEANLYNLCSFLIVEEMRRGKHPKDAGMEALHRIKETTVEKRLLNSKGEPNFYVRFYIINARGEHAGVSMFETNDDGSKPTFAMCNENGPQTLNCDTLLAGKSSD